MKKRPFLLLILVIAGGGIVQAQVEPKAPMPQQTQAPVPAQLLPVKQSHAHRPHALQPRWSFNITAGPAFPAGEFAHTDRQAASGGPVHTGALAELNSTYHLSHTWGITLLAAGQYHRTGMQQIIVPGALGSNPNTTIPPQHWNMTRILAGGAYTLPLNRKGHLNLLARALAGLQRTHIGEHSLIVHTQDWNALFTGLPARNLAWTFSYQADAGLQWKPYRRWSVLAFAGYNGCRPSYKQDISTYMVTGLLMPGAPHGLKTSDFPTGSILLRAGVGYDL